MQKRQLGTLFLATCLVLITIPAALGAQSITVSPTSSSAQTAINNAINTVATGATSSDPGTVILTSGTYQLSGPIIIKSNVHLKGAGDSTIIYAPGSVCNSASAPGYIYGSSVSNIEISHLQFKSDGTRIGDGGYGEYRNCIEIHTGTNGAIHDIKFSKYLYNDGAKLFTVSGFNVYNCRIESGHDAIEFLTHSHDSRAYNNDIDITVNTGIRVDNGYNIELDHNTLYGLHNSGWCMFEMESSLNNINIHHNILHDYMGSSGRNAAVQDVHASGNVNFHDNVLWNVGEIKMGAGTGNIINPSDRTVANWVKKGYGYGGTGTTTDTSDDTESPVAAFSATPTTGSAPLKVTFTDTSTGEPTSWKWEFGDGTSSTRENPTHTYSKAGSYTVNLTVKNSAGTNKITKSNFIVVTGSKTSPVAAFSATPITGSSPLKVTFTDTSTGTPTSWKWEFGDGTSSTRENPTHTYSKAGSYTVNLTVKNSAGTNKITKSNFIVVTSSKKSPVAAFSIKVFGKKVIFTDKSTGSPTSYYWYFGDKSTSKVKNPSHTYIKAGTYYVTLIVKDAAGKTSTKTITVKVS